MSSNSSSAAEPEPDGLGLGDQKWSTRTPLLSSEASMEGTNIGFGLCSSKKPIRGIFEQSGRVSPTLSWANETPAATRKPKARALRSDRRKMWVMAHSI
jgi:hypothetical protein